MSDGKSHQLRRIRRQQRLAPAVKSLLNALHPLRISARIARNLVNPEASLLKNITQSYLAHDGR